MQTKMIWSLLPAMCLLPALFGSPANAHAASGAGIKLTGAAAAAPAPAAAAIKFHWTNVGAYTYSWKCDIENTDNHRPIAVVVKSRNDHDPLHPFVQRYVMGPRTFQTVGMFMFNAGVEIVDAQFPDH